MTETGFPTLFPSFFPPTLSAPTYGLADIRGGQGSLAMLTPFNFQDAAERGEEEVGADHFHLRRRSRKDTIYTKGGRQQEADRGGVGELQKLLSTNSIDGDGMDLFTRSRFSLSYAKIGSKTRLLQFQILQLQWN